MSLVSGQFRFVVGRCGGRGRSRASGLRLRLKLLGDILARAVGSRVVRKRAPGGPMTRRFTDRHIFEEWQLEHPDGNWKLDPS